MNELLKPLRYSAGYFRLVTHSLLHRKLRASLTVVGVVIGISIVLTLVFLGNGLQRSIIGQLRQFGSDLIFVLTHEAADPFAGLLSGGEFTDDDVDAARRTSGVASVSPIITNRLVSARFRGEDKTISLEARERALIQEFLVESVGVRLAEGDWMAREDSREAVIGANFASSLFREPIRVGDPIDVYGRRLVVAGILEPFGDRTRDNIAIVTIETFRHLSGERGGYGGMLVKIEPGRDIEAVGRGLEESLSRREDLEEFTVLTPARSEEVVSGVIGTVQAALFLIAAVAVLVAGIGVLNVMYTSVLERTREIGIMRSVGARSGDVMSVFLFESAVLGLAGGAVGTAGGAGLAELVAFLARRRGFGFFEAAADLRTIVFVLAFTMIVGLAAGVLPALQAARKRPVEALRYR